METKDIIIIVVAVLAVLLIAACVIVLLKKRGGAHTEKDVLNESKDRIAANAQMIEVLLVLAKGKENTIKELEAIQDQLKYLTPSTNEKVKDIDEKIKAELGDLKIELSKKKEEEKDEKTNTYLENIRIKIAERSTYTDRL